MGALRIKVAKARLDNGAHNGARRGAEFLLGITQNRVPLEEGDLQRTGRVTEGSRGKKTHNFGVVYGGQGLDDYARRQHEELTWNHAPGRTAKYVEDPLAENAAAIKAMIAEGVREQLR